MPGWCLYLPLVNSLSFSCMDLTINYQMIAMINGLLNLSAYIIISLISILSMRVKLLPDGRYNILGNLSKTVPKPLQPLHTIPALNCHDVHTSMLAYSGYDTCRNYFF